MSGREQNDREVPAPLFGHLVANARFHDTDFARRELLQLLAELPQVRTRVTDDYADTDAIAAADFLVTYTCDLRPSEREQRALYDFVHAGGRWIALHGTNAILDFTPEGVKCPRTHDLFMETLGSRFIAHPTTQPYEVRVSDPSHPLVAGFESFEVSDELYLCEYYGEVTPLLETRFHGAFESGYVENVWPQDEPRLVAYTHPVGAGEVLYITLGHCCGPYDMRPIQDIAEVVRGSWENPIFMELLRRALRWGARTL